MAATSNAGGKRSPLLKKGGQGGFRNIFMTSAICVYSGHYKNGGIMNLKELALELGMEQDEMRELLVIFIESSESDLVKLKQALIEGDAKQVADAAHSIKGASANLGFMDIFSVAKNLEQEARENSLEGLADEVHILKDRLSLLEKSIDDI
jgi:HPt (histidine-containing phosphotransfer) domain-containing protein